MTDFGLNQPKMLPSQHIALLSAKNEGAPTITAPLQVNLS